MKHPEWESIYKSSLFAFHCPSGEEVQWTLLEVPGPLPQDLDSVVQEFGSFTLLTAWNPMSEERPFAVNEKANLVLRNRLEAAALPFEESYGESLPGVSPSWREDGFVIFGLTLEQAQAWGASVQQRAVVFADEQEIGLLFCTDGRFVPCGVEQAAT